MRDALGAVLALIRADTAVLAIVGTAGKVSTVKQAPPYVELVANVVTRRPTGAGSGRAGLQLWVGFARCYGTDDPAGAVLAMQLGGAVSDALHNRRPVKVGTTQFHSIYAPEITPDRDPLPPNGTGWPVATVRIEAYAAAQAIA